MTINVAVRQAMGPQDAAQRNTAGLRAGFLVEGLFKPDEINLVYSHLDRMILSGSAHLWTAPDAAIVAEIRTFPTGARALHGLVAAGTLETITGRLIPAAEAWARERGCLLSIVESRPGWARALKQHGYVPHQLAVMKEL